MSQFFTITKDRILQVNAHPGQVQMLESQKRIVMMICGTQSGKSSSAPFWLLREIKKCGPGDYLGVTPSFPLLDLKLLPEFKRLFQTQLQLGTYTGNPTKKFVFTDEGAKRLFGKAYDRNVPTQVFFGHAQDPDSLESATAKAAILDEAGQKKFKIGSFQAIQRRLAIHQGRMWIGTTPYQLGWLKDLHDRAKRGDPDLELINFRSIDNPSFPRAEYERAKRELPPWKFNMFYNGIFTRPAGLIYDNFDKDIHTCPPFEIPKTWERYLGQDYGPVHTAAIFIAEHPLSKQLFLYREYLEGSRTAKQHADALKKGEPGIPTCVGGARSEDNWRLEFRSAGLPVRPPLIKDVEVGINRVYKLLASKRLQIFDTCTGTLDQIQSYSRELDDKDEPTDKIEDKESFHYCLAAGTMIETPDGLKPIENVTTADFVLTRYGYQPCLASQKTMDNARVYKLTLDNGYELVATGNHPIFMAGGDVCPIDALRYNDTILICQKKKPSFTKGANFIVIQKARILRMLGIIKAGLTDGSSDCIGKSGQTITEKFQQVITFITRMVTLTTTPLKILNACLMLSTLGYISKASLPVLSAKKTSSESVISRKPGIVLPREAHGTKNMAYWAGLIASPFLKPVPSVEVRSRPKRFTKSFVQTNAKPQRGTSRVLTMKVEAALPVETCIPLTNTLVLATARVVALEQLEEKRSVYNLSVANHTEYFANGILNKNCDALRYISTLLAKPETAAPQASSSTSVWDS